MKYKNMIFLFVIIGIFLSIAIYTQQLSQNDSKPIDVPSLIEIETFKNIKSKRVMLENYIWANDVIPITKLPTKIEQSYVDTKFDTFQNVERIDRISIDMEYGVDSIAYMFFPRQSRTWSNTSI